MIPIKTETYTTELKKSPGIKTWTRPEIRDICGMVQTNSKFDPGLGEHAVGFTTVNGGAYAFSIGPS